MKQCEESLTALRSAALCSLRRTRLDVRYQDMCKSQEQVSDHNDRFFWSVYTSTACDISTPTYHWWWAPHCFEAPSAGRACQTLLLAPENTAAKPWWTWCSTIIPQAVIIFGPTQRKNYFSPNGISQTVIIVCPTQGTTNSYQYFSKILQWT